MLSLNKLRARVRSVLKFRVRRWHVAMRGWEEQDVRVLIDLEEDVWYWAFADWFAGAFGIGGCEFLRRFTFPAFILNWKRAWDTDEPTDVCTFREWYGEEVCCLWHMHVESPLIQWAWKHKSRELVQFEMTLDEARQKFAHDPSVYKWVEENVAKYKQWDAEAAAEKAAANESKAEQ